MNPVAAFVYSNSSVLVDKYKPLGTILVSSVFFFFFYMTITTLHYIALHYTTLHYITLPYITRHFITLFFKAINRSMDSTYFIFKKT